MSPVDPVLYSKYHQPQERDVQDFLAEASSLRDWGRLKGQVVADVGCGPGNTSCAWTLSMFPDVRRVVAMDVSEGMVGLARILNPHPKIEYVVADISDRTSVEFLFGTLDKVFSFYCLQYVEDVPKMLQNIFSLLKPGGEAAIMFENESPYHKFYDVMFARTEFSSALKDKSKLRETNFKRLDTFALLAVLKSIGFEVRMLKEREKSFTFSTDEDCIGFLMSFCSSNFNSLYGDVIENFRGEFLRVLKQNGCLGHNGYLTLHYNIVTILLKKPK